VAAVLILVITLGGLTRIGAFCGLLVPPMCIIYIVGALGVVIVNITKVPEAFGLIFRYAFAPAPALGGFVGSTVSMAMSRGASRGIFSNEAGMGTATTVHATAKTDHPIRQGMWGIVEVFIDTIIVCNLTAFSILVSGVWTGAEGLTGAPLTFAAFETVWGTAGMWIVCVSVALFCFSSTLGFFVEFRTAVVYIFGEKAFKVLKFIYFIPPIIGAIAEIEVIWTMADFATGFLVIPNIIALALLTPVFMKLFKEFREKNPV
jgi:AGCS family alanine or glycine:cation symporter